MIRQFRHLVEFDVRRVRWMAALWIGVVGIDAAALALGPDRLPGADTRAQSYQVLLLLLRWVGNVLVTTLVIQGDSLVGSSAFWRTRPIRRDALFAGKLAVVALLVVVVPAVATSLAALARGLALRDVVQVALHVAGEQGLLAAVACAGAAITGSLAQFAVAALAGLAASNLTMITLGSALGAAREGAATPLAALTFPAFALVVAGAALVVAGHQYARVRTTASCVLGVGMVVALTIVNAIRPWQDFAVSAHSLDPRVLAPGTVSLSFAPDSVQTNVQTSGPPGARHARWEYWGRLHTTGEPADIMLVPRVTTTEFLATGAAAPLRSTTSSRWQEVGESDGTRSDDSLISHVRRAGRLDEAPAPSGWPTRRLVPTFFSVPSSHDAAPPRGAGHLRADIAFETYRLRNTATLPIHEGASAQAAQCALEIATIATHQRHLTIGLRLLALESPRLGLPLGRVYLLRLAGGRRGVIGRRAHVLPLIGSIGLLRQALWSGVEDVEFVAPADTWLGPPDANWDDGGRWWRDAELLVIEPEALGSYHGVIDVPDFDLEHPARAFRQK